MKIKNFELKLYLGGWINNVGYSSQGLEYTLMVAMRDKPSIKEWFSVSEVDYDEEYALKCLKEFHLEDTKK